MFWIFFSVFPANKAYFFPFGIYRIISILFQSTHVPETGMESGRRALQQRAIRTACLLAIRNINMSLQHGSPQCMCCMNIHKHTRTALGCTDGLALASGGDPSIDIMHLQVCVFNVRQDRSRQLTTMERLDKGHLYPLVEHQRLTCLGRESNTGLQGGKRALYSKELFEQHVNSIFGTST